MSDGVMIIAILTVGLVRIAPQFTPPPYFTPTPMLSNVKRRWERLEQTGGLSESICCLLLAALAGGVSVRQTSWQRVSAAAGGHEGLRLTSF